MFENKINNKQINIRNMFVNITTKTIDSLLVMIKLLNKKLNKYKIFIVIRNQIFVE